MKRPWVAYVAVGVLAAAAGTAIAGLPSTPAGSTEVIAPPASPAPPATTPDPADD